MITLSSTTDKIQIILDSAVTTNQLQCYSVYRDTTTTSISPLNNQTITNGVTAVDLVSSPASSTQRLVEYISVYNSDTQPSSVTIRFSDNGTYYTLFKARIQQGDKLEYSDKDGFKTVTKSGSVRKNQAILAHPVNSSQSAALLPNDVVASSVVANGNNNSQAVPFGFPVTSGSTYYFRIAGFFNSSATTNGARFNLTVPSIGANVGYYYWTSLTSGTWTTGYAVTNPTTPTTIGTTSPSTSGNVFIIDGFVSAGADGFVGISVASDEVSPSSITFKGGNRIFYHKVV
jgi:hypothetical protein